MPNSAARTCQPGYENNNRQKNLGCSHLESSTKDNAWTYHMLCLVCQHAYGCNDCDIWQRRCPSHDGGEPGNDWNRNNCRCGC